MSIAATRCTITLRGVRSTLRAAPAPARYLIEFTAIYLGVFEFGLTRRAGVLFGICLAGP